MQGQISGPWMFAVKSILGSPSATSFAVMITTASSSRPEPGPGAVASSTSAWVPRTVCPGTPARPPTSSAIVGFGGRGAVHRYWHGPPPAAEEPRSGDAATSSLWFDSFIRSSYS